MEIKYRIQLLLLQEARVLLMERYRKQFHYGPLHANILKEVSHVAKSRFSDWIKLLLKISTSNCASEWKQSVLT